MRVITGSAKGRKLLSPNGLDTRPTSDRVKEAVFNIIQFEIEGRRVLDLFAGSGQLAIEALSRGAADAVLVDHSTAAIQVIRENLQKTGLYKKAHTVCADYLQYIASAEHQFDLIFLDPPYAENLLENALQKISEIDILSESGIIICEKPREKELPARFGNLRCSKDYRYSKTTVNLYFR